MARLRTSPGGSGVWHVTVPLVGAQLMDALMQRLVRELPGEQASI